uniref:Variant surface glycoprotein n=1 Tax=Trypanosoma brucei TaxID=5691 RepID=A0A1V0FYR6_9TRYP|nr:variant surface glycoprotein [Trypanosoma brucei]
MCTATSGASTVESSVTHQAPDTAKLKGTTGCVTTPNVETPPSIGNTDDVHTSAVNTAQRLAQAPLAVKTELLKQKVDLSAITLDPLATSPISQELANILLLSDTKRLPPDHTNRSEQLKTLITKEFGPENTAFSTVLVNIYDTTAVTLLFDGKPKSKKLNTITNPENFAKSIGYLAETNQPKQRIEANKDQCSTVGKDPKQLPSKEELKEHIKQGPCKKVG